MVIRKTQKKKNIKTLKQNGGGDKYKKKAVKKLASKKLLDQGYKLENTKKQKNSWKKKTYGYLSQGVAAIPAGIFALGKARSRHVKLKKTQKALDAQKAALELKINSKTSNNENSKIQSQINSIQTKLNDIQSQQSKSKWQKYKNAYKNEMGKAYSQGLIKYSLSAPGKALRTVSAGLKAIPVAGKILKIPILKQLTSNKFLKTISSAPALKRYTGRVISNTGKRIKERIKQMGKYAYYKTRRVRGLSPFGIKKIGNKRIYTKGSHLVEFIKADQKRFDKLKTDSELESKKIKQNKLRLSELEMKTFKTSRENDEIANLKTDISYRTQKLNNYKNLMYTLKFDIDTNLKKSVDFLKERYKTDIEKSTKYIKGEYAVTKSYLTGIDPKNYNITQENLDNFKKLFENKGSFELTDANSKDMIETAKLLSEAENDPTKKMHFKNLYSKLYDINYRTSKLKNMELYEYSLNKFKTDYEEVKKLRNTANNNKKNMEKMGSSAFIGYSGTGNTGSSIFEKREKLKKEIEEEKKTREDIKQKMETIIQSWKSKGLSTYRIKSISAFLQNYDFMKWATDKNLDTPSNVVDAFIKYKNENPIPNNNKK